MGQTSVFIVDAEDRKVGIGDVEYPNSLLHIVREKEGGGATGGFGPVIELTRTENAGALNPGEELGSITFGGYVGGTPSPSTTWLTGSVISSHVDTSAWNTGNENVPTALVFSVAHDTNSTTPVEAMRINRDGMVGIGTGQYADAPSDDISATLHVKVDPTKNNTSGVKIEHNKTSGIPLQITSKLTGVGQVAMITQDAGSTLASGGHVLLVADQDTTSTGTALRIVSYGAGNILEIGEDALAGAYKARIATGEQRGDPGGNIWMDYTGSMHVRGDGTNDRVFILSGSSVTLPGHAPNEQMYKDVNFFVSGSVGGRGNDGVKNTALFGGDLVVSGAVHAVGGANGWLHGPDPDTPFVYLQNSDDKVGIGTDEPETKLHVHYGASTTSASPGTSIRVQSMATHSASIGFINNHSAAPRTEAAVVLEPNASFTLYSDFVMVNSQSVGGVVLKGVHVDAAGNDAQSSGFIFDPGDTSNNRSPRILLLSGSRPSGISGLEKDPRASNNFTDTSLYISGSSGGRNSPAGGIAGTTVVGGDVVVSGSMYVMREFDGSQQFNNAVLQVGNTVRRPNAMSVISLKNDVTSSAHENSPFLFLKHSSIYDGSAQGDFEGAHANTITSDVGNFRIVFLSGAAGDAPDQDFHITNEGYKTKGAYFLVSGSNRAFLLSGSLPDNAVHSESDIGYVGDPRKYTDTALFVSGAIGVVHKAWDGEAHHSGAAVFGGDLVVSGGLYADGTTLVVDPDHNRVGIGVQHPDTQLHIKSTSPSKPVIKIENQQGGTNPVAIQMLRNTTSPADGDFIGDIHFRSMNDAGTPEEILYAYITAVSKDITDGTEDGEIQFHTMKAGVVTNTLTLTSGSAAFSGDVSIGGTLTGGSPVSLGEGAEVTGSLFLKASTVAHNSQAGDTEVSIYARNLGSGIKLYQNIAGDETELGGAILVSSGSTEYSGVTQLSLGNMATVTNEGSGVLSLTGSIGSPEDGDYSDGLFTSFTAKTPIGTMVDRFNEVLAALAPPPAPPADDVDGYGSSTGTAVYLTWGTGNSISGYSPAEDNVVNTVGGLPGVAETQIYQTAVTGSGGTGLPANQIGAWGGNSGKIDIYGTINADVPVNTNAGGTNYVAYSFGEADQGELQLWLNGTQVTFSAKTGTPSAVDLTAGTTGAGVPGAGSDSSFVTSNGTGFIELSAVKSATSSTGDALEVFKHRTGRVKIAVNDQRNGLNMFEVRHVIGAATRRTNYVAWVVDTDTTAMAIGSTAEAWGWVKTGATTKDISGVTYYSSLGADASGNQIGYLSSIANAYKYTYDLNQISFTPTIGLGTLNNAKMSNQSLNITNQPKPPPSTAPYHDNQVSVGRGTITGGGITFSADYILGGALSTTFTVTHPLKNNATLGGSASLTQLLYYTLNDTGTALREDFTGETKRIPSGSYANKGLVTATAWSSSTELDSAAGYGGGVDNAKASQVYATKLYSPKKTLNNGNYSTITNGPSGNPDYSALGTGLRVYYRYFTSDATCHGFKFVTSGDGSLINAGDSSLGANNKVRIFFKVPNTGTTQTGWLDAAALFTWHNSGWSGAGDKDRLGGAGVSMDTTIDSGGAQNFITFGTGSIVSGDHVVMKIEHDDGWTGDIDDVTLTFTNSGGTGTAPSMPPDTDGSNGILQDNISDGAAAKLSFDSSNTIGATYTGVTNAAGIGSAVLVNGTYTTATSGNNSRIAVYSSQDVTGIVNGNVAAVGGVYVADAFGYAMKLDTETTNALILEINGVEYHTMNLVATLGTGAPGSGTANSLTGNSGFTNVSAAAPATYGGNSVPDYSKMYRTARFIVHQSQQREGWNYVRVIHRRTGVADVITNYIEWVKDDTGGAQALAQSGAAIANFIVGGGGTYSLSGVTYFVAPKGTYSVTVSNAYKNVYSSAADAITISPSNGTVTDVSVTGTGITDTSTSNDPTVGLPNLNTAVANYQNQDISISTDVRSTVSKVLPGTTYGHSSTTSIGVSGIAVKAPLKSVLNTTGATKSAFLIWSGNSDGTSNQYTAEHFVNESYRVQSGSYVNQGSIGSSPWTSTVSMNDAGNPTYEDGMIIYNSYLFSPKGPGANYGGGFAGDFRSVGDGGSLQAPSSNPNYSSLNKSQRTYYRYFENNTTSDRASVSVTIKGDATIVLRDSATLGANKNIYVDVKIPGKLPSQDVAGSGDFSGFQELAKPSASSVRDYGGMLVGSLDATVDGAGATNTITFNGQTLNGTTSGAEKMIIRITASENWTGYITEINVSYS